MSYSTLTDEELLEKYKSTKNLISIYDSKQMGGKILINSFYGILANKHFRLFDVRIAESITLNGQMAIQYIAEKVNIFLNKQLKTDQDYIIYGDTDSIMVSVQKLAEKHIAKTKDNDIQKLVDYLDKCGNVLNKEIDRCFLELKEILNLKEHQLIMEREGIFEGGAFVAKKRYFLKYWDMEGVRFKEPKMKIMGLETQRSTTPKIFREKLAEILKDVVDFDNLTVIKKINKFKTELNSIPLNELSSPTGCNNLEKYSDNGYPIKGCPGHIRAAITYNRLISSDKKLKSKYPLILEGEKALVVSLKEPNPVREKSIAYVDTFPEETGLLKYIDREDIFYKKFLKPLESIFDSIGWKTREERTIERFF